METTYSKSTKYDGGMPTPAAFQQHLDSVPTGASTTVYFDAGDLGEVPFDITSTWTEADLLKQQTADRERARAVEDAKATLEKRGEPAAPSEDVYQRRLRLRHGADSIATNLFAHLMELKRLALLDEWLIDNEAGLAELRDLLGRK